MSRLENYEKKQTRKRAALFIGIGFFVVAFLVNAGIPLLINASAYLGSFFVDRTEVIGDPNAQGITINVDPVPEATSKPKIVLTGSTDNIDELHIYINGSKADEISTNDGDFEISAQGLQKGKNEIIIQGKNTQSGRSEKSDVIVIDYLSEKPLLEISAPEPDSTTLENNTVVVGKTNDSTNTIRINGQPVVLNSAGEFSHSLRLQTGDNTIKIVAANAADEETEVEVKVKREK